MERLTAYFLKRPALVNLIVIATIIYGIFSVMSIRKEGFPPVHMNRVLILTSYPGSSPRDVELNVTAPIEERLAEIEGIDEYESMSREGFSMVSVAVDEDASEQGVRRVYDDIQQAVDRITDFPDDLRFPPVLELVSSSDAPVVQVALQNPDGFSRDYVNHLMRDMEEIPGVARLEVTGLPDPEVQILVDPDRAMQNNVGLRLIADSIRKRNQQGAGGDLESFVGQKKVVSYSRYENEQDILDTILRMTFGGYGVRLRDVATVESTGEDTGLRVRNQGQPGVSLLVVMKDRGDILETVDGVHRVMQENDHPQGVEYSFLNDQSRLTRDRLSLVITNAVIGFTLVILVLFLIFDFRTSVWTAFGIPFSLLGVFILLYWSGYTLNVLTLGGFIIVLGMLVDDAIVVAEEINTQRELGLAPLEAATTAVSNVWKPVFASAMTTMIAFTPLLSLGGLPGKFIWLIPLVVILSLVVSLFESYFILPSHLSHGKTQTIKKSRFIVWFESLYTKTLLIVLRYRYIVSAVAVLFLFSSIAISFSFLKKDPFPQDSAEGLTLRFTFPLGSSLAYTEQKVKKAEKMILSLSDQELAGISTRVGTRSGDPTDERGGLDHGAIVFIYLTPYGQRDRTATEIGEQLRGRLQEIYRNEDMEYLLEIMRIGPPLGRAFEIRLSSNNEKLRDAESRKLQVHLKEIPGVLEVDDDTVPGKNELNIMPQHDLLAQAGLAVEDILTVLRISFDGMVVSAMTGVNETRDIRLRLEEPARADPDFLKRLPVSNRTGQMIHVNQLVRLEEQKAPGEIRHINGVRTTTVYGTLDQKVISPEEIMNHVRENYEAASGVRMSFAGQPEETKVIFKNLRSAALFAGVGIYLVIALIFQSFLRPLVVLLALPFGLPGVLGALATHGMPISMFAGLAVIGLMGVIVNGSIVMVYTILKQGRDAEVPDHSSIVQGAVSRLRPLTLTTFTTVLGLFPTAYSIGGFDPFITPMCLALSYGLLVGTAVILLMIPALLAIEGDIRNLRDKIIHRKKAL